MFSEVIAVPDMQRDDYLRIALRYDTALSRAMLRALGVDVPHRIRRGAIVRVDRYNGMEECFMNRERVRT